MNSPARAGHVIAKEETLTRLSNSEIMLTWEKSDGIMFSLSKSIV